MFIIIDAPSHLLGERERAGVQRVGELLVVLGDHAGAGAARAVQRDELEVEQRRDLRHRSVQLWGEAAAYAAGPVGDLHQVVLPSGLAGSAGAAPSAAAEAAATAAVSWSSSSPAM